MRILAALSPAQLEALAAGIRTRGAPGPTQSMSHTIGDAAATPWTRELEDLLKQFGHHGVPALLDALAAERRVAIREADGRLELVWTGPEREASGTRDTAVVMRELLSSAKRHILVAGYALFGGHDIFEPLAERLDALPALRAILCLNVGPGPSDARTEPEVVAAFGRRFLTQEWPGRRVPELYYLKRAFYPGADRAVLHAKVVAIDDERAFVTSANLTEAAQSRNIEAGVLLNDPGFAKTLRQQFLSLIESGELLRVPIPDGR